MMFVFSQGLVWVCEIEISHMGKNNGNPNLETQKSVCYDIKPVSKEEGNLIGKFLHAMTMLPGKNNAHN